MTTKKIKLNRDIIIEELKKIHGEYLVEKAEALISGEYYDDEDGFKDRFFTPLATNLLKKLNKLNRENVVPIAKE